MQHYQRKNPSWQFIPNFAFYSCCFPCIYLWDFCLIHFIGLISFTLQIKKCPKTWHQRQKSTSTKFVPSCLSYAELYNLKHIFQRFPIAILNFINIFSKNLKISVNIMQTFIIYFADKSLNSKSYYKFDFLLLFIFLRSNEYIL